MSIEFFLMKNVSLVPFNFFFRAHAKELGNPVPTKPILFLKPTTAYITQGQAIKVCIYTNTH